MICKLVLDIIFLKESKHIFCIRMNSFKDCFITVTI